MKKGLKIAAITVGVIIILMLLLPFAFEGKIAGIVKTEGNKMLNAQFDFKDLSISLFRDFPQASVTLEDFWLKGTGNFASDTLVQAGKVTAAINLFSLFGDSGYDISKIFIEDTRLHAIVLPDGRANWDIMKPDSTAKVETPDTEAEASSPFKVKMQRFVIKNMDLTYDDQQAKIYADIHNFNALCAGDLGSDHTTLKLEAETEALTYKMNGIPFLANAKISTKMDVDADLVNNKYILKDNTFQLNAIQAGIDGWFALKGPAIDMDFKLITNDIGFKEILSLIPSIYATEFSSLKTDGTATLTASAKGILQGDTVPTFNLDMQVKNAMFRYPALPAGVDQINISAKIENPGGNIDLTTISINPFSFNLAGNPFKLIADIKTPVSDPDFKAEAKGMLNLGMIKQVYPMDDLALNGTINADMQMSGRLSYIEKEQYDNFKASGTIGLTDMKLKMKDMPDVEIKKSLFTFTPQFLQLSETTVNMGKNDITADSRFENYIGYVLKGTTLKGSLNVRSNYLNLNDFMTASTDSTSTASTSPQTSTTDSISVTGIVEVPRNLDLQMDANLKQVLLDKMSFNNVNGKLIVKDGKVDMKNLSMNTMGGNVVMNGYYSSMNVKKPEVKAGFKLTDISFTQAYKELDMVQKLAPIFENLKGNFSGGIDILTELDATMTPVLNTMQGDGSLSVRDLSLSGVKSIDQIADAIKQPSLKDVKVKDMKIDFTIKDGRVNTKPFDIKMGDYTLNLSGSTGLDQTIDYIGKIKLPASGSFSKLSTVDLKIGGSFTSPKVSVDMKSMANQAVEAAAEEAIDKLGKKLGLDSGSTSNKDSLKQKAAEKALDLLKKLK
ncbi:AsmA-like C-terminal region-containing protein [Bacteroides sp.]|uniref:AsmA family protein n=1 Tax=Bacteroides sp. TaxID=29523 RepID=UPI00260DF66D|nr:AsmA-like C-terminal region-containing protein [Bacteroides sp.]MDD3037114.1 AsmA-like C-terminal region-containing protein [Bacteroides sp.]